jgi:hypothetical protein
VKGVYQAPRTVPPCGRRGERDPMIFDGAPAVRGSAPLSQCVLSGGFALAGAL